MVMGAASIIGTIPVIIGAGVSMEVLKTVNRMEKKAGPHRRATVIRHSTPKYKVIQGKRYKLYFGSPWKKEAVRHAETLRRRGLSARVVETTNSHGHYWMVWTRR